MRRFSVAPVVADNMIIKILLSRVIIYSFPDIFSQQICYIVKGNYLKVVETYKPMESPKLQWAKINVGWLIISDGTENKIYEICYKLTDAQKSWRLETEKQSQMASAISSMLIRSYSLPKAKRLARSLLKHAIEHYSSSLSSENAKERLKQSGILLPGISISGKSGKSSSKKSSKHSGSDQPTLMKITNQSMEDIMIILDGQIALTKQQIFEYIKASAARNSNPLQSTIDITSKMYEYMNERPTEWVTNDLPIIITEDIRIRNNQFVMTAAEGNCKKFLAFLESEIKINLLALHSELQYTALHAAADFGRVEIVELLIDTGLSLDIKDPLRGQTALHFAAYSGRADVAKLLIDYGANRELKDNEGIIPYQAAHKQGYIETREILKFIPPAVDQLEVSSRFFFFLFFSGSF
jgi:hypothetical protein